jgi:hypothetical protein
VGQKSLMAGDQNIGKGHESGDEVVLQDVFRMILKKQLVFFFVHVQSQETDFSRFNGADDFPGIDQTASTCIDEHDALFHFCQALFVDQVTCLGG